MEYQLENNELVIKKYLIKNGVVYYKVRVIPKQILLDIDLSSQNSHHQHPHLEFRIRYSELRHLNYLLKSEKFDFPPKKCVGNLDTKFIKSRRFSLQVFLD